MTRWWAPSAALLLVMSTGAGCASELPAQLAEARLPGRAVVRLSEDYAVAARSSGQRVEVLAFRGGPGGWADRVLASERTDEDEVVQLMTMAGETGEEWNSFVYGRAGPAVSRVEVRGLAGSGGQVVGGAWVIALREKDVTPAQLDWRFIGADGAVLRSGRGLLGVGG